MQELDLEESLGKYRRAESNRIRKQPQTSARRQGAYRSRVARWLSDSESLRKAWVLKEILGPPKGL